MTWALLVLLAAEPTDVEPVGGCAVLATRPLDPSARGEHGAAPTKPLDPIARARGEQGAEPTKRLDPSACAPGEQGDEPTKPLDPIASASDEQGAEPTKPNDATTTPNDATTTPNDATTTPNDATTTPADQRSTEPTKPVPTSAPMANDATSPQSETSAVLPTESSKRVEHGALNTVGLTGSTTAVLAISTGAALTAGLSLHFAPFAVNGRPNPWVSNGGVLLMLGVQFAIAHLLVPQLATWWRPEHDVTRVREKAWEFSRWPLAAGALGALTYTVGAVLDETRWGRGDAVMAAGLLTTILSLIVFDVVEGLATLGAVR